MRGHPHRSRPHCLGPLVLGLLSGLAPAQPTPDVDLGLRQAVETIDLPITLASGERIYWVRVELPEFAATGGYLDIFNTPTATPIPDTDLADVEIGLYDHLGNRVANDDDSGPGPFAQLSFGSPTPARPATVITGATPGLAFTGQNGPLAPGVYWLALGRFNVTFGSSAWTVTSNYAGTQRRTVLHLRVRPEGASVPIAVQAAAAPALLDVGTTTLLTAAITPGDSPPSTGLSVTADLSGVGGAAQIVLLDDGTHGDATANDLIFSRTITPLTTGDATIPVVATDDQGRTTTASVTLRVSPPSQWDEAIQGERDAGDTIAGAMWPVGDGTLTWLTGNIDDNDDVDVYVIDITDAAAFAASTTLPENTGDTQLFLFNLTGLGLAHNDNDPAGGLLSALSAAFVPGLGRYALGVTRYNRDPIDAQGRLLWLNSPSNTERRPDGPGAQSPLASWTGVTGVAPYRLRLAGVAFPLLPLVAQANSIDAVTVPPATLTLQLAVTPGVNPASTGLIASVDLTPLGGAAATALHDDGLAGDATANDGVYTLTTPVPADAAEGPRSLAWTARDDQGRKAQGIWTTRVVPPPDFTEDADAGDLPALAIHPAGTGPLRRLVGDLGAGDGVDMYRIRVCDAAAFRASTVNPETPGDTRLYLFRESGEGVGLSDDAAGPDSGALLTRAAGAGVYYLAISRGPRPLDTAGLPIWQDTPRDIERPPDGPDASRYLDAWTTDTGSTGPYRLVMSGVCFPDPVGPACDPDYTADGNADQDDVRLLIDILGGGSSSASADPDFNHDGNVDQIDLIDLVAFVAGGACP